MSTIINQEVPDGLEGADSGGEQLQIPGELPGVRAEQVEVALTNEELRVRGRKRKGAPRGVISHLCSERSFGPFARTIMLRWPVRKDAATAELRDGVLTIRLPKLEDRRGVEHKIEVKEIEE